MADEQMMRALILDTYDGTTFRDAVIARPHPLDGQVLVKIHASGVNPIDYKIRKGQSPYAMPVLPAVLGTDMAGVVESVGPGVTRFEPGDQVYGLSGGVRGLQGSLAEYVAVDADLLALKPKNLTMREAAALPLVVLTAWEGLVDRAKIVAGQKILVHGGAGGVGHVAVQLARAMGAHVFATVSAAKFDIVRELGATPIDYQKTPVQEYVTQYTQGQGFDVIYDTVGDSVLEDSLVAIRHYGHILSCAAFGPLNLAPSSLRSATLSGIFVLHPMLSGEGRKHHSDILREVATLVENEQMRPLMDPRRFSLDSAMDAHNAVESGSRGKVVIEVTTTVDQ